LTIGKAHTHATQTNGGDLFSRATQTSVFHDQLF
jgi:hypothetical protein